MKMKLGAERKKIALLGMLTAVAGYSVYTQLLSDSGMSPRLDRPIAHTTQGGTSSQARVVVRQGPVRSGSGNLQEPFDPMMLDPTLRTELLAKVRVVTFEGVRRDLFRFRERNKVKVAPLTAATVKKAQSRLEAATNRSRSINAKKSIASKLVAPPIKWKYYGFANSSKDARKRAFLIGDEDQIFIATEGDVFKKRYRVIHIGVNSIVVEDLEFKDQQSLPLEQG